MEVGQDGDHKGAWSRFVDDQGRPRRIDIAAPSNVCGRDGDRARLENALNM
jgi:hypothetical protein